MNGGTFSWPRAGVAAAPGGASCAGFGRAAEPRLHAELHRPQLRPASGPGRGVRQEAQAEGRHRRLLQQRRRLLWIALRPGAEDAYVEEEVQRVQRDRFDPRAREEKRGGRQVHPRRVGLHLLVQLLRHLGLSTGRAAGTRIDSPGP